MIAADMRLRIEFECYLGMQAPLNIFTQYNN